MTRVIDGSKPHPYELGFRDGRWQPYGCKHCDHPAGSEIHNPELWDDAGRSEVGNRIDD